MKTLKAALATVTCNTICTVCGKPADAGYLSDWHASRKEGCVAMIHDGYSIGARRELIRKWGKSPRLSGVPGAGLIDMKRMQR